MSRYRDILSTIKPQNMGNYKPEDLLALLRSECALVVELRDEIKTLKTLMERANANFIAEADRKNAIKRKTYSMRSPAVIKQSIKNMMGKNG